MSQLTDPQSLGRHLGATSDMQQQAAIKTSLLLLISFSNLISKRYLPLCNLLMSLTAASLMSQCPTRSPLFQQMQIFFCPISFIPKFLTSVSTARLLPSCARGSIHVLWHSTKLWPLWEAGLSSQIRQPVQNAQSNGFAQQNYTTRTDKSLGKKEMQISRLWDFMGREA